MNELGNNKFLFWFDEAKRLCEQDPDVFAVYDSDDQKFINYLTYKMPIQARVSARTVLRYLYDSQLQGNTSNKPEDMEVINEFRDWFYAMKCEQEMKLYKRMKTNDKSWQREDNILAKRFGKKWHKKDHMKIDADVVVKHTLCDKLRKIAKVDDE